MTWLGGMATGCRQSICVNGDNKLGNRASLIMPKLTWLASRQAMMIHTAVKPQYQKTVMSHCGKSAVKKICSGRYETRQFSLINCFSDDDMAEPWLPRNHTRQNSDRSCHGAILRLRRSMKILPKLTSEIPKFKKSHCDKIGVSLGTRNFYSF
jgi:hypothetical protein